MKTTQRNFAVVVFALLFTTVAIAQSAGTNQDGRRQGRQGYSQKSCNYENQKERMASYLELTEQQSEQISQLRLNHQKKILPLKNELGEKKAKMKTLSTAENADMKAINTLIDEMGTIKTKLMKEKASHKQEVRKNLNEEQRIKYDLNHQKKGRGYGHGKCHN